MTRLLLSKNAPTDGAIASRRKIVTSLEVRLVHRILIHGAPKPFIADTLWCLRWSFINWPLRLCVSAPSPPPPPYRDAIFAGLLWSCMKWPSMLFIRCATPTPSYRDAILVYITVHVQRSNLFDNPDQPVESILLRSHHISIPLRRLSHHTL